MEQPEIKVNHIETKSVMTKSNTPIGGYSVNPYYAITQLTEDQQRLIDYVYFKGYSMKSFAEIEGVSPVAITYRHKEILKKLKEIF